MDAIETFEHVRRFADLTPEEQQKALDLALTDLLRAIVEDGLRFNDSLNGDDLQARIDRAGERAEAMRTPWFWHEYIADDEQAMDELRSMAAFDAADALYVAPSVRVIRLEPMPAGAVA